MKLQIGTGEEAGDVEYYLMNRFLSHHLLEILDLERAQVFMTRV